MKDTEQASQTGDKSAILYVCEECGWEAWKVRLTPFGHFVSRTVCDDCGNVIKETGER